MMQKNLTQYLQSAEYNLLFSRRKGERGKNKQIFQITE